MIVTSVECRSVVHICSDERRFSLSAHCVVPHPPDATLERKGHTRSKLTQTQREREAQCFVMYLSVCSGSPTLAAGVAAVGPQCRTLHRVRRAGRGSCTALREAQASAIVLLALLAIFSNMKNELNRTY